jgi:hypothetical protein
MKKMLLAAVAWVAFAAVGQAADMHKVFVELGETMQKNLVCHTGGPIHLADYPLDPDVADFASRHSAQAHQWAIEGVRKRMALGGCQFASAPPSSAPPPAVHAPASAPPPHKPIPAPAAESGRNSRVNDIPVMPLE